MPTSADLRGHATPRMKNHGDTENTEEEFNHEINETHEKNIREDSIDSWLLLSVVLSVSVVRFLFPAEGP
jgi:hypothetical protein